MDVIAIGFSEFRQENLQALEPMLAAARSLIQIGQEMIKAPAEEQFPNLTKQITRTVSNSMEAVLLLISNGCGVDGLRLARTMFEAAIVLHYLESHPELVEDFIDYQWVIPKKHQDYLRTLPPDKVPPVEPEKITEMQSNYQRVKHRFIDKKGRDRNSWCKANLREMAKEVNGESMYGGLYPFGSSMTHTNILAIIAGAGPANDVEPVPSERNIELAVQAGVMSFAMTLMAFDKIANLGWGDELETAFNEFRDNTPSAATSSQGT